MYPHHALWNDGDHICRYIGGGYTWEYWLVAHHLPWASLKMDRQPRDDSEALGYMLVYLMRGRTPLIRPQSEARCQKDEAARVDKTLEPRLSKVEREVESLTVGSSRPLTESYWPP